jgi:hypothetical protein
MSVLKANSLRFVILASGLAAATVAGWVSATSLRVALGVLAAAALAVALPWASDTKLLVGALVVLYYVPTQAAPHGLLGAVPSARWIGVVLVPLLAAALLLRPRSRQHRLTITPVGVVMCLLAVELTLSALMNGSGGLNLLLAFLMYLRYPLLFVALVSARPADRTFNRVIGVFVALTLLQVPEVLLRFFEFNVRGDRISFTLGPWGTWSLGVYCVYSLCLIVAAYRFRRLRWLAPMAPLVIVLLLVPAVLGEIKALLIGGPLVVLVVLAAPRNIGGANLRRVAVAGIAVCTAVVLVAAWGSVWVGGQNTLSLYTKQIVDVMSGTHTSRVDTTATRVTATRQAIVSFERYGNPVVGTGPGSSLAGNLTGRKGRLPLSAYAVAGDVQILALLYDGGVLGLAMYYVMLIACLVYVLKVMKSHDKSRSAWLGFAGLGMWSFYALLGPWYYLVWRFDASSFMFWLLMAYVYLVLHRRVPGQENALVKRDQPSRTLPCAG